MNAMKLALLLAISLPFTSACAIDTTDDGVSENDIERDGKADNSTSGSADVLVTFQLRDGVTSWGEDVYVVGDIAALGKWDPQHAIRLTTASQPDPNSSEPSYTCVYPNWCVSKSNFVSKGTTFQYKYIKIGPATLNGPGAVTWENGPNRKSTALPVVTVEDDTWR